MEMKYSVVLVFVMEMMAYSVVVVRLRVTEILVFVHVFVGQWRRQWSIDIEGQRRVLESCG